jgi:2-oxo-3-hexenedioate decarboxylase
MSTKAGTNEDIAGEIRAAVATKAQIAPITDARPDFNLDDAYAVSGMLMRERVGAGARVAGWKIGFTNRTIWDEYGVDAPIWGAMYDNSILSADEDATLDVSRFIEPRIEPEIVFRIATPPRSDMDDAGLLSCIDAVAHGFEIVQCVFPGWRFRAADTVAAMALHGALVHGPLVGIKEDARKDWLRRLGSFDIALLRDDEEIDRGSATNVLGGPLSALRHFIAGLESRPMGRGIESGDLITTGTVTRAFPIKAGQTWSTSIEGLPLRGLRLTLAGSPAGFGD